MVGKGRDRPCHIHGQTPEGGAVLPTDGYKYILLYSDGSLNEPSSPDEPAAILNADLLLDLLYFIHGCPCIISTVEKIWMVIAMGVPKIC